MRRVAGIAEATDDSADAAAAAAVGDDDKVSLSPSSITDSEKFMSHNVLQVARRVCSGSRLQPRSDVSC